MWAQAILVWSAARAVIRCSPDAKPLLCPEKNCGAHTNSKCVRSKTERVPVYGLKQSTSEISESNTPKYAVGLKEKLGILKPPDWGTKVTLKPGSGEGGSGFSRE